MCNYLFVLLFQLEAYKRPSFSESINLSIIIIIIINNVKNLGFIFDDNLNFFNQIANVCKSTNYQLYKIRSIRKFLTFRIYKMLKESLVMSHINYCCTLYYGLPATSTKSLYIIIRSSIRVLHSVTLYDHESVNYHLVISKWLNIYQRSTFRYLKLMFKVLKNRLLSYLIDILQFKVYKRNLRNASTRLLQKKNYKISKYGKYFFSVATADLWNSLPVGLRTNVNYYYLKSNLFLLIRKN